ncbi:hypothetical protein CRUP_000601 [Coryphaenoides rupestris]|nr:hypothetical protein CRUP_000601 [Coryphaenoides rupestris]
MPPLRRVAVPPPRRAPSLCRAAAAVPLPHLLRCRPCRSWTVVQSIEDHHLEVIALCREGGFHGLVAYDSDYALVNMPCYFSGHALKLSRNGKSLTTSQYLMHLVAKRLHLHPNRFVIFASLLGNHILPDEDLAAFHWSLLGPEHPLASLKYLMHLVAKRLHLHPNRFVIFASLLGNHILPDEDLAAFHWSLLGPEHPLASLKVRAHQLVLPPCDVVIKAVAEYVRNVPDTNDLDTIAKDIFTHSQSCTADKVLRFRKAVAYYTEASKPSRSPAPLVGPKQSLPAPQKPLSIPPAAAAALTGNAGQAQPLAPETGDGPPDLSLFGNIPPEGKHTPLYERSSSATNSESTATTVKQTLPPPPPLHSVSGPPVSSSGGGGGGSRLGSDGAPIPSLLSMATRSHMDVTLPPLPPVAPEVLRVAEHRHRQGLICSGPSANSPVMVKEWAAYKGKPPHAPELVEALAFREWTCPNLRRLWLGRAAEDKNRRMRAFLACMRSDTPALLNPAHVPAHLLVLCCVLRFMLHWPGVRILRRNELDAFLAQALSPKLYEAELLQDLKIDSLDPRGVQLGALFMTGVDMALFANDACGQPVPWENCCPWMYFDGKLFQSKLTRASRDKAQLLDLCDGQMELAGKVEKMRQSILEGLSFARPPHPMAFPAPPHLPPRPTPTTPCRPSSPPPGPTTPLPPWARRRAGRGSCPAVSSPGGKLEIAGTVVGHRLRGVISTPVIRPFGRGARYHSLALKGQPTFLGPKPTHVSAPDDVKERRKPSKPEEAEKEKKKKAGPVEIKGHGGVENGVPNGVGDGTPVPVNGDADAVQSGSAFSSPDAKACNTTGPSPYLTDALSLGTGGVAQALLGGVAEALLALEE